MKRTSTLAATGRQRCVATPEVTLSGWVCNGIIDLRKGTPSCNAPEAPLSDLGTTELFNRRYGGGLNVGTGANYIDAKLPGIQAVYERTSRAKVIAAFIGLHFDLDGQGTLNRGSCSLPFRARPRRRPDGPPRDARRSRTRQRPG